MNEKDLNHGSDLYGFFEVGHKQSEIYTIFYIKIIPKKNTKMKKSISIITRSNRLGDKAVAAKIC